jgi:hypothetical protein
MKLFWKPLFVKALIYLMAVKMVLAAPVRVKL